MKPYIAKCDGDSGVFKCPKCSKLARGFHLITTHLVDNSGFGADDEPALTPRQFLDMVKSGRGYGIVEEGQFQVIIGEFFPKKMQVSR